MEVRCESNRGGDEVDPATLGNEEETGLKLDDNDDSNSINYKLRAHTTHNLRITSGMTM